MKNNFIFFIFFILFLNMNGQESVIIQNLKSKLQFEKIDTVKIDLNLKIYNEYTLSKNDSSHTYFNNALDLAKTNFYKPQLAKKLYDLGINFENNYNYEFAISNFQKSVLIYEELKDASNIAKINNYIGYCYINLYAEDKAIEYYLKSLKGYKELNDDDGIAMNYNDIGNLYYDQGNFDDAKKYFQDALTIYEKLEDKEGIASSYTNLGNTLADGNEIDFGIDYFKQSIILQEEINDLEGIATNYNNLGDCYIQKKKYKIAQEYFVKALKIAEELKDDDLLAIVYLNMADVYGRWSNYDDVILTAQKSLSISQKTGKLDLQLDNLMLLANAYEAKGDASLALDYFKKHNKIKDSILGADKSKSVQLFNALNELEKTHYTIDELANKNEIAQLKYETEKKISYFLIISIVVFGFFLVLIFYQQAAKKKAYNLLEFRNYQINKMNAEIELQRDDLKSMNKTKDKFFSIIAHDLKNPFNSIQGFTELMIENNKSYDEEKRLKFLKIIKDSTNKASILLNNLLIWANSQSGNLTFTPQKIELVKHVMDVVSFLEIQAIKKEIDIYNNIDHNLSVNADVNMLNTILRNLISNAIKFTNAKGEIKILSTVKDKMVEICVKDNGVGMTEEEVDKLFSMDEKSTNVGTANEMGSGLGLILCKDFVEKHGGKIMVSSVKGQGSEFVFTIPLWSDEPEYLMDLSKLKA
ncbi:tetratricopeptide repeat protein [Lutibacter sp. HS1-25]|uniref:tetratricopeptide repeat-containing sensor histidine kinase n=1 Tax=Lutibacter sp. HS1-25 TaxID=2485000 RepID=UPI0010130D21|nr:tetratricopeptide repeat protein [Lutibacter sp. HS1-25]RXP57100.1 tetratricopeptide repeat protein [Lutibacter sp. HS1-25]